MIAVRRVAAGSMAAQRRAEADARRADPEAGGEPGAIFVVNPPEGVMSDASGDPAARGVAAVAAVVAVAAVAAVAAMAAIAAVAISGAVTATTMAVGRPRHREAILITAPILSPQTAGGCRHLRCAHPTVVARPLRPVRCRRGQASVDDRRSGQAAVTTGTVSAAISSRTASIAAACCTAAWSARVPPSRSMYQG